MYHIGVFRFDRVVTQRKGAIFYVNSGKWALRGLKYHYCCHELCVSATAPSVNHVDKQATSEGQTTKTKSLFGQNAGMHLSILPHAVLLPHVSWSLEHSLTSHWLKLHKSYKKHPTAHKPSRNIFNHPIK